MTLARTGSRLTGLLSAVVLVLVATPAFAQVRTAQLTAVDGKVLVWRKSTGQKDRPQQVGHQRVQNGSIFGGDVVIAEDGASAAMIFADCSTIEMSENTAMSLRHVDMRALPTSARGDYSARRLIEVHGGRITADIAANPVIETRVETAAGLVSVNGATLELAMGSDGSATVRSLAGSSDVHNKNSGLRLIIEAGHEVRLIPLSEHEFGLYAAVTNPGEIAIELPVGRSLRAAAGTELLAASQRFSVRLTVVKGQLFAGDDRVLSAGEALGYANTEFQLPSGTRINAATQEGSVEFFNPDHGMQVMIEGGFSLTAAETDSGELLILAGDGNPSDLQMRIGQRAIVVQPGGEIGLASFCDQVNLRTVGGASSNANSRTADAGLADLLDGECLGLMESADAGGSYGGCEQFLFRSDEELPTGEDEEEGEEEEEEEEGEDEEEEGDDEGEDEGDDEGEDEGDDEGEDEGGDEGDDEGDDDMGDDDEPVACGECAVPDGFGGCTDVDSMCDTDPCIVDRRCIAGSCTGGRRLTSLEDPNCGTGGE